MAEKKAVRDERPVAALTVAELRDIVRDEVEAVLGESRGEPGALLTVDGLAALLNISTRTLDSLRDMGLPTVWVTPDSPRFERAAAMTWIRGISEWFAAGRPSTGTFGGPEGWKP